MARGEAQVNDEKRDGDDEESSDADDGGKVNDPLTQSENADKVPRPPWGEPVSE